MSPPASLCTLPVDVLNAIALVLPCREFGRLLQTNRYIHDTLDTHWIWHQRFVARMGQGFLTAKLKQVEEDAPAPTTVAESETECVYLNKTSAASKEQLIEWYRQYSRTVIPSRDMAIIHMGNNGFHWTMSMVADSQFGEMARLGHVNWLDVSAVFHGVVPGQYYVQWGLVVNSVSAVQYTLFRAVALGSHEFPSWDNTHPDTIGFKPQRATTFIQYTNSPTRKFFKGGPMIFQHPDILTITAEYPTVFVQFKDHDNIRIKSSMSVDYVRLVRVDDWDNVIVPEAVDAEWVEEERRMEEERSRNRGMFGGFGQGLDDDTAEGFDPVWIGSESDDSDALDDEPHPDELSDA
ncbi:hypothetical protein BGZ95_011730 [Linnemannia exigua]|uniref:F-box domain-containing protein n=1 Tax=Linnemannia exigua TaxID=604196 RepID=A0AAD4D9Q7_9FUNG|nr:hypothetical protein BGZ95_011730 [Linnemannia exigua]